MKKLCLITLLVLVGCTTGYQVESLPPIKPTRIPTNTSITIDTEIPIETSVPVLLLNSTTTLIPPTKTTIKLTPKSQIFYSDSNVGISFDYPDYMTINTDIIEDKGKVQYIEIYTSHTSGKIALIYISTNEDPPFELLPERVRLSDELLRIDAEYRINNFDLLLIDRGISIDEKSKNDALNSIEITSWKGYKSTFFHAMLNSSFWGDLYVKSAHIYTDEREIEIVLIGGLEPPKPFDITVEYIDDLWNNFLESLIIDY